MLNPYVSPDPNKKSSSVDGGGDGEKEEVGDHRGWCRETLGMTDEII